MIWWQNNPEAFERFQSEIAHYSQLTVNSIDTKIELSGRWPVWGKEEKIREYEIRIVLPDDYPVSVPRVFEIGGAIPWSADFHINSDDGSACLFVQPERHEQWPLGSGMMKFLEGPVKAFFFSQAYHELSGLWPFGEWRHGDNGILQYYADRLNERRLNILIDLLETSLLPKIYRQWKCPCSSGKRTKYCHGDRILRIKSIIPPVDIKSAIGIALQKLSNGISEIE